MRARALLVGSVIAIAGCSGGAPATSRGFAEVDAPSGTRDQASNDASGDGLPASVDVAPSLQDVRFVGRGDTSDPAGPRFGWPGARVVARFVGTEVAAELDEVSLFSGPSRWDVLVDGVVRATLAPAPGVGRYTLASALPAGEHTIELYRRTEGTVGTTQFRGFAFRGGHSLAPPAAPARRIEFLGDSHTAGYGNECVDPNLSFSGATENERLAFSGLVARELDADHHTVAFSGKGALVNFDRGDTVVFEELFPRTLPAGPPDWTFSSFVPDVVWLMLGDNDWSDHGATTLPPPPDRGLFTAKYAALTERIRTSYPQAHVFCAIAPSQSDAYPEGYDALTNMRSALASVASQREAAGDTRVYVFEFARAEHATDLTGCDYHGNLGLHRKMADQAIAAIRSKTRWP